MSMTLKFKIKLSSDYHLSSGHRGLEVDSALFRDYDGVPALRGTTVAALLRDGLLRLIGAGALPDHKPVCKASGLEKGPDGKEPKSYCRQYVLNEDVCPVCQIFGSPKTIKSWAVSSARPVALAKPECEPIKEEYWASQSAMRVRVDPRMRRAEARKLFSQEEGDSRLQFEFTVSNIAGENEKKEAALIVAAARMVRHLGGSRRRGRGECVFSLEGEPAVTEAWLDAFKELWIDRKPSTANTAAPEKLTAQALTFNPTGSSLRLQLLVRADEPILIARHAESGNEFHGLEAIPGTTVRGAFAGMAASSLNEDVREFFKTLFFSERLRFSPLYPVKVDGEYYRPAFPAPLDFHVCKLHESLGKTVQLLWHLREPKARKNCPCPSCKDSNNKTAHTSLRKFVYVDHNGALKAIKPNPQLEMHNTIDPATWRVEETKLFSYVPQAGGQYFAGEIFCEDESIWNLLKAMTGLPELNEAFSLKLGKASRRGYGSATAVMSKSNLPQLWIGQKFNERVKDKKAAITLLLMSDAIVPDCWGRFYTGFEKEWLGEVLETKIEIGKRDNFEQQFVGVREVDSFNMKLGLPRWRDIAIVAGSSVLLKPVGEWNLARLEELERNGMGLRCNEGFGWVAFNHPVYNATETRRLKFPEQAETEMQLQKATPAFEFSIEFDFRQTWGEMLDKDKATFNQCNDTKFGAVARLLRAEKHTDIDALEKRLASLGNRDNLDVQLPKNESNWFQKDGGQGKRGLAQIVKAMQELTTLIAEKADFNTHSKRLTAIGIEMLADRVAEEANKDNKGENS